MWRRHNFLLHRLIICATILKVLLFGEDLGEAIKSPLSFGEGVWG